jgi:hypothetical protein
VPTNGLVGWWPFNGNANDESGNGNNGTVNGATLTADRNGNNNSAYSFDGLNDWIVTPNNSLFFNDTISISVWGIFNSTKGFHITYSSASNGSYVFSSSATGGHTNTNLGCGGNGGWGNFTNNLNVDWHNLIAIIEGNKTSLYLDGTFITSWSNAIISCDNLNNKLHFGVEIFGSPEYSLGNYDDLGIWRRALTQQEITDLYNAQTCTNPSASITPQSNTTFCQGGSVNLNASTGTNFTYEWYKNGQIINGATASVYQSTSSGNYTVKVIDGACDATSTATTVTVNSNPTVNFTLPNMISNISGNVTLNGNPIGGSYQGSGVSGNVLNPSNSNLGKQTMVYDYIDNNGCSGSKTATTIIYDTTGTVCTSYVSVAVTDTLIIDVSLAGLSAPNNINTMKVYPNPSNDIVNIDNGDYALMNGYSIKIINVLGQERFSNVINIPAFQIPVNQLGNTGVYYINIYDNQSQLVESKVLVLE